MMDNLNKENFWNDFKEKYPKSVQVFLVWLDAYKNKVGWNELFNSKSDYQNSEGKNAIAPKFHELPLGFQTGVIAEFMYEQNHDLEYRNDYIRWVTDEFEELEKEISEKKK